MGAECGESSEPHDPIWKFNAGTDLSDWFRLMKTARLVLLLVVHKRKRILNCEAQQTAKPVTAVGELVIGWQPIRGTKEAFQSLFAPRLALASRGCTARPWIDCCSELPNVDQLKSSPALLLNFTFCTAQFDSIQYHRKSPYRIGVWATVPALEAAVKLNNGI